MTQLLNVDVVVDVADRCDVVGVSQKMILMFGTNCSGQTNADPLAAQTPDLSDQYEYKAFPHSSPYIPYRKQVPFLIYMYIDFEEYMMVLWS